jgi:hypothetical protein
MDEDGVDAAPVSNRKALPSRPVAHAAHAVAPEPARATTSGRTEPAEELKPVPAQVPAGYTWSEASGYYYSAETNYFYDAQSGMYFDNDARQWFHA